MVHCQQSMFGFGFVFEFVFAFAHVAAATVVSIGVVQQHQECLEKRDWGDSYDWYDYHGYCD